MKFPTTVSIVVRANIKDSQSSATVQLQLADQINQHRFTKEDQQHRLTVTADLEAGNHPVSLEFLDKGNPQAGVEIQSMYVQGAPVGMHIYQCEYTQQDSGITEKSHLYMGKPGTWKINVRAPRGGVGFV